VSYLQVEDRVITEHVSSALGAERSTDRSPLYAVLYAEGADFRYHKITSENADWRLRL